MVQLVTVCDPDSYRGVCRRCLGIVEVEVDERGKVSIETYGCDCWESLTAELCEDGAWVYGEPAARAQS